MQASVFDDEVKTVVRQTRLKLESITRDHPDYVDETLNLRRSLEHTVDNLSNHRDDHSLKYFLIHLWVIAKQANNLGSSLGVPKNQFLSQKILTVNFERKIEGFPAEISAENFAQ